MNLKEFFKKFGKRNDHKQAKEAHEPSVTATYEERPIVEEPVEEEHEEEGEKERLTRQFRSWLDSFDQTIDETPEPERIEKETDLFTLFSEFIALKSEVKRQSRQVQTTLEEYRSSVELLKSGFEALQKEQESAQNNRQSLTQELERMSLRMIIMEVLDIRDRIEEGVRVLKKRKASFIKRIFGLKDSLLPVVIEGQEMILNRFDRMLYSHGVTPVEVLDKVLDPHLMRAIEVDSVDDKEEGVVLEEIRKGFMFHNKILRVAEVKVNKRNLSN